MAFMTLANAEDVFDNGVLVLTDVFDEAIAKYDYLLVEFYAPWCGHCKKLTPEYEAAAAVLSAQDPPRTIAKVDATENKAIADRMQIQGFPTLYFFNQGNKMDYTGGRTKDTIIDWINKKTGPVSVEVDCAKMESSTADAKLALAYFGSLDGDLYEAFMKGAKNPAISEKYTFFHTSDADCASKYGVAAPGIALARNFDESPLAYAGGADENAIVKFAKDSSVPRLITFSEDYIEPIFGDHQAAAILFTEDTDAAYQASFAQVAKDMQGEILFVTSGVTEGIQSRLGEFIGVGKDDLPSLRIINPGDTMLKYTWEGDAKNMSADDVKSFVSDFKAGKLQPSLKSDPIPDQQTVDGLTTLVGKTWDQVVKDTNKDVLVKYYAPWCGHCKALAPVWDELAKDVEAAEDLVIAKFDSTTNEVAGLEIRGYPTLKFYPKGNKEGIDYSGDRQLADFQQWLSDNSSAYQAFRPKNPGAAQDEL